MLVNRYPDALNCPKMSQQFTLFFTVQSSHKTALLVGTSGVNSVLWVQMTKYGDQSVQVGHS